MLIHSQLISLNLSLTISDYPFDSPIICIYLSVCPSKSLHLSGTDYLSGTAYRVNMVRLKLSAANPWCYPSNASGLSGESRDPGTIHKHCVLVSLVKCKPLKVWSTVKIRGTRVPQKAIVPVGRPSPYSIIILNMRFIPKASLRASSQITASSYILERHL